MCIGGVRDSASAMRRHFMIWQCLVTGFSAAELFLQNLRVTCRHVLTLMQISAPLRFWTLQTESHRNTSNRCTHSVWPNITLATIPPQRLLVYTLFRGSFCQSRLVFTSITCIPISECSFPISSLEIYVCNPDNPGTRSMSLFSNSRK